MSHGRRDLWITGFVAFVAWGLAVQQLPLLRFLGYAFNLGLASAVAGLLLLSLTTSRTGPTARSVRQLTPILTSPERWHREKAWYVSAQEYKPAQLYPDSFVVSQALDGFVSTALRNLIASWYTNISPSPRFVNEIDRNVRAAVINVGHRLQNEDLASLLVARLMPIVTAHLKSFDQADKAIRGRSLNRNVTESEELDFAIAGKYNEGKIHPAASLTFSDTKVVQQEYLRNMLVRLLPTIVPANVGGSRAVSVLVKEIVACAVLSPILQMLAEPDTWNQIIEAYGRAALQDRKTVKQMRAALDEHASPVAKRQTVPDLPRLSPNDSERAFERFVRAVRKTKTLSDARRFRSQIASQLVKASSSDDPDPIYSRRLEMAKRVLDQKIARLSQSNASIPHATEPVDATDDRVVRPRDLPLTEIMHTVSGLSSFMEFMDRQNRMSLVQFWIVVDGFRNPLEDDFGDDGIGDLHQTWTDTDRLDIAQISETYVSRSELKVPRESQDAIRAFLMAGRDATPAQYRAARVAILSAQSAILEELNSQYFPLFRKSDLYFKFLASDEANAKGLRPQADPNQDTLSASNRPPPTPMIRSASQQPHVRQVDLRRAALSSSDVKNLAATRTTSTSSNSRKPTDVSERPPLFDDGYDTDPLAHSSYSIDHDSQNDDHNGADPEMIENMEAALTDIIAENPMLDSNDDVHDALLVDSNGPAVGKANRFPGPLSNLHRAQGPGVEKSRPSLATLGLVNTSSRIGVFSDNDLFGDEEKFAEDEYVDQNPEDKTSPEDEIHAAAPGDLGLTEAITVLTNDIERLVSQESVVDTLTRKAELTNNVTELRILGKSKASLQREIRRKELQRQQYIVQESDNSLYGRSHVRIKSVMVGKEDDGHEFALYVIEVQRQAGDQMPAAIWAIARRYSEFHDLHQRLRQRYPSTRHLEFPRRRMVMKLQKQFLQNRRVALESYLQQLLNMPDVCRSRELRSFLSQQAIMSDKEASNATDTQDLVTRIYNSVTDGMDEFLGNIAVLDQLSAAGQNLISAATGQAPGVSQSEVISIEPGSIAEAEAEIRSFEDKELEPFVKPICDIFLEIFELNRGNNWLRGRAVVVVLHQLLGGTVERKIRDVLRGLVQEEALTRQIDQLRESLWPANTENGSGEADTATAASKNPAPRTAAQKAKSKKEATILLTSLIPDLAGSVVGRANAQTAARRIMSTLNNKRLNEHIVMTIFDEIMSVLFGSALTTGNSKGTSGAK